MNSNMQVILLVESHNSSHLESSSHSVKISNPKTNKVYNVKIQIVIIANI